MNPPVMSKAKLAVLTIHIPQQLLKELKMAAAEWDVFIRSLVIEAIEEKLEKLELERK